MAWKATEIVSVAVETRAINSRKFEDNMSDNIREYTGIHQYGENLNVDISENWLEEASKAGEVYPQTHWFDRALTLVE